MSRHPTLVMSLATLAAMALLGGHGQGGYWPRVLTLDEEEERSVQRMMARAAARRRATERERRQAAERAAAIRAAEIEAARPKSRQELRARERQLQKIGSQDRPQTRFGRVIPKQKSSSLERMLGRKKKRQP